MKKDYRYWTCKTEKSGKAHQRAYLFMRTKDYELKFHVWRDLDCIEKVFDHACTSGYRFVLESRISGGQLWCAERNNSLCGLTAEYWLIDLVRSKQRNAAIGKFEMSVGLHISDALNCGYRSVHESSGGIGHDLTDWQAREQELDEIV